MNQQERIWQRSEKIRDFDQDVQKATAKISKICSNTVQKEFLSLQKSTEWKPKELWEWLEERYTLQSFASKWEAARNSTLRVQKHHRLYESNQGRSRAT